VLIELNARLEEQRNVNWWRTFDQAGGRGVCLATGIEGARENGADCPE
jgi:polyphosphate kinase